MQSHGRSPRPLRSESLKTVMYIGDVKCKVSFMPKTMTAEEGEAAVKLIRGSKFFDREESLYKMRRKHVKNTVSQTKSEWTIAESVNPRTKTVERSQRETYENDNKLEQRQRNTSPLHKTLNPQLSAPFLGVGNWPQPIETKPLSSSPPSEVPKQSIASFSLPQSTKGFSSPRTFEAIPVKSFVLTAERQDSAEIKGRYWWMQTEFYKNYKALWRASKERTPEESPKLTVRQLTPPTVAMSLAPAKSGRQCEGGCRKGSADIGVQMHQFLEHKFTAEPKLQTTRTLIPLNNGLPPHSLSAKGLKPRPFPAKVTAYRSALDLNKGHERRHSTESISYPLVLTTHPGPTISEELPKKHVKEVRKIDTFRSDLPPRNLPPHRIPVEFHLFRNVRKLQRG